MCTAPLGLLRGTVALQPHQPAWAAMAAHTAAHLRALLGPDAIDIQHVGSTAIPGMAAKPIIDLAVALPTLAHLQPHLPALAQAGFIYRGQDVPGQLLLVRGDFSADTRTHHIHVLPHGSPAWCDYLALRDYCIACPAAAAAYQACKQTLAARYPHDRAAYSAGKASHIACLLQQARAWRQAHPPTP